MPARGLAEAPLVSVITPTKGRHGLLRDRCAASVLRQTYPEIEHIVVSDGPDPDLARILPRARIIELAPGHGGWGCRERRAGLKAARGSLIAYLDDDDEWTPRHCELLVAAFQARPDAKFAYARALSLCNGSWVRIGDGPLAHGRVLTGTLMHRATLRAPWPDGTNAPDWELVRGWLTAGHDFVSIGEVTHMHYPSARTMPPGKIPTSAPPWR